ncbi:hypothetical protein T484DRAFT_1661276 [Baffinella frigidus]|nr:hypothetical protein T484DRAFT_1661276 [Cryptophyta sp. CCMP2293]
MTTRRLHTPQPALRSAVVLILLVSGISPSASSTSPASVARSAPTALGHPCTWRRCLRLQGGGESQGRGGAADAKRQGAGQVLPRKNGGIRPTATDPQGMKKGVKEESPPGGTGLWGLVRRVWANRRAQAMPVDQAMVGSKRGREESSTEEGGGGSTASGIEGRGGARGKLDCECTICGKFLLYSSLLARHMLTHTGDRPYACTTCGKAFAQSGSLMRHMRTHSGDRPFVCTTCGKAFAQSGSLMRHMRTHDGVRPFVCTTCGKAFSVAGSLTRHMRAHAADRPYACTTCGKAFSVSSDLTRHTRRHTADRPFACTTCGKAFSDSSNLSKHMRRHSGDRSFVCTTCGKVFSQSDNLATHRKTKHALDHK